MDVQTEAGLIDAVARRMQWILILMMFIAFMDRTNISFVAAYMNHDIGLNTRQFGLGASLFFLGYLLFEVPSNLMMARVGARRWLARIMITWGIVSSCSAFVTGCGEFYAARFLLGVAEAGFIPGVMLYLSYWSPQRYLGKFTGWFMMVIPISASLTALITAALLALDHVAGMAGWRWAFLLEGVPAVLIGCFVLRYLADTPESASWLDDTQKRQLQTLIAADRIERHPASGGMLRQALATPQVWIFGVAYFFLNIALGAQTWFPLAVHPFHLSRIQETILVAIPSALASLAMMLWARRSDRANERIWHVILPCGVSALAWYGASRVVGDAAVLTVLMSIAYCAMYAALVVFWTMPTSVLSKAARPVGLAIVTAFGLPGSMLSLSLGGKLRDSYGGFSPCFLLAAAGMLLCGLAIATLSSSQMRTVRAST
jgi:ACS family tartrate transporter-like MFS transporter